MSTFNATGARLREQAKAKVTEQAVIAALPPLEAHIFDAANAHLLNGYILFEIIGRHCPLMLSTMNDDAKRLVEAYIRKYVIVAE